MIRSPRVVLCTLVLNEMEWLPRLYEQHRHWPGRVRWVFVESADAQYAASNPDRVTKDGLSVDGTTDFLSALEAQDKTVTHVRYGFSRHDDKAQGKCRARSQYLYVADQHAPDFLIVVDADEFYPKRAQEQISGLTAINDEANGFIFRHREIWFPPCRNRETDGLFEQEVTGGFWSIPYCRVWRWHPGLQYVTNHNTPETSVGGVGLLDQKLARYDDVKGSPYYCHMAFASSKESRVAKHRYYEERGEKTDQRRKWYCESRRSWVDWRPGAILPHDAKVVPYDGLIPECFR